MENNLSENTDWKKDKDIGIILFFACCFFFFNKTKQKSCQWQSHNNSDFEPLTIHPLFQKQKFRTFRGLRIIFPGLLYEYISYLEIKPFIR